MTLSGLSRAEFKAELNWLADLPERSFPTTGTKYELLATAEAMDQFAEDTEQLIDDAAGLAEADELTELEVLLKDFRDYAEELRYCAKQRFDPHIE